MYYKIMLKDKRFAGKKTKLIEVLVEDDELMMTVCKEIYLKAHPQMRGVPLSKKFLYRKIVDYYINT